MKIQIALIIIQLFVITGNVFCQESEKNFPVKESNFDSDYQLFIETQKTPLLKAPFQAFLLNKTIWKRNRGDSEFYLSPSFKCTEDQIKYKRRIKEQNGKAKGISNSIIQLVKVEVTPKSIQLLADFGVVVPSYIQNFVNISIPKVDIDSLVKQGINVIYIQRNLDITSSKIQIQDESRSEIIWSEGFEGTFPGNLYRVYDGDDQSGFDYWDDVTCEHYEGNRSIWCAGIGDQADCENYDDNMFSCVEIINPIIVTGYTNVYFNFKAKWESEVGFDYLTLSFSSDGNSYDPIVMYDGGNSNGWSSESESILVTNFPSFYWQFIFSSDGSAHNYTGAYLDDMSVVGDEIQGYDCFPLVEQLEINGNPVDFGSTIDVQLENLDQTFEIRLKGKNDDQDMAPPDLSNLTLSFEQYTTVSDKNLVTVKTNTSQDLIVTKYFGNTNGGDQFADYVLVEGQDHDGWEGGESNSIYLDVKPKQYGPFVIEFRMGLPTDDTWTNFIHDPPDGYCPSCNEWTIGVDPIKFISYYVIVNILQPTPCLTVTPNNRDVPFTSGSTTFNVSNPCGGNLVYTAQVSNGSSWLTITNGASGGNNGTIEVSYIANPDCVPRTGTINVSAPGAIGDPTNVFVSQAGNNIPILSVTPQNQEVPYSSGTTYFTVTNIGCGNMTYSAQIATGLNWLQIIAGGSGGNSGIIEISYDEKSGNDTRTGVLLVNADNATNSPQQVTVTQLGWPVGLDDKTLNDQLTIFPNPANAKITITSKYLLTGKTILFLYNIKGEMIMLKNLCDQKEFELDVSSLPLGVYMLKIQSTGGVESKKLVIQ